MKQILFLFCSSFITYSCFAQASTQFGIKAGANLSMFSASINSEVSLKPGFNIGVYLRHGKTEKFHLRPELYFSSQGQKDNYVLGNSSQSIGKTETTLNALNLPVLFEAGRKVVFQFGPQLGILLSGNEKGTIQRKKTNDDLKDVMKGADLSVVVGLGVYVSENLNLGARYNFGVSPVFEKPQGAPSDYPSIANRVIHFYLGYSF